MSQVRIPHEEIGNGILRYVIFIFIYFYWLHQFLSVRATAKAKLIGFLAGGPKGGQVASRGLGRADRRVPGVVDSDRNVPEATGVWG